MACRPTLADRTVTLGVTGGIAAYKSAEIVRLLRKMDVRVQVVMTQAAIRLMSPHALATLSEHPVATDLFAPLPDANWLEEPRETLPPTAPGAGQPPGIEHIRLSRTADLLLVAPATANILGKVAAGIADDLLSTSIMASSVPVMFAPAMNVQMWENPIVQENVARLREKGYLVVDPDSGDLACGESGAGRMADPERIVDAVARLLLEELSGLRVLVTAGPTEEPIDPVRVLSNRSSGKMGVAIAEAARDRGHAVTLIAGPLRCAPPLGVERIDVETAQEMQAAVVAKEQEADILIMAAAVADYRPRTLSPGKMASTSPELTLDLVRNPDILAGVGRARSARGAITIGFALEPGDGREERAREKLKAKGLEMIVLNDPTRPDSAFGADTTRVTFLFKDGTAEPLGAGPKARAAREILVRAEAMHAAAREAPPRQQG